MDSFEDHLYWRELRRIYQAGKHEPLPASGCMNVERGNAPKFSPKIRQRGKPMSGDGRT